MPYLGMVKVTRTPIVRVVRLDVPREHRQGVDLAALGIGPAFVSATTTMANVPPGEAGVASGVISTFHELGGSIVAAADLVPGATGVGGFTAAHTACAVAVIALSLVPPGRPSGTFTGHGHGGH